MLQLSTISTSCSRWLRLLAWAVLIAVLGQGSRTAAQAEAKEQGFGVLKIELIGPIDVATVSKVYRGLREAKSRGAERLLVVIDTPGGELGATREVQAALSGLRGEGIHSVAWVKGSAWSAGAYIALACNKTFMASNASIGAVIPVEGGPGGVRQIPDGDIRRKAISALRGEMRSLIQSRGDRKPWAGLVAEGMVDPDLELVEITYVDENGFDAQKVVTDGELRQLEASGTKILSSSALTQPVTLDPQQAIRLGFSSGTFDSLEMLLREEYDLTLDDVGHLQGTWSEDAASWLRGMQPLLFILGFIMLLIELKSPGVGVPGVLGLLLLGMAMFGNYLVGLAEWFEILLFFGGIGLIAVEIFLVPGTLVAGITGFFCIFIGWILAQQDFVLPGNELENDTLEGSLWQLLWMLLSVIAGSILVWKLMPYIPVVNRILQPPPVVSASTGASTQFRGDAEARSAYVGRIGEATTDLRPAGILTLDGDRLDVVSSGGYIEQGTRVRVTEVVGNRIVVERVDDSVAEQGTARGDA